MEATKQAKAMNILHMTLTKKWFDMILSGEKKQEYREIKPYWVKRFGYWVESTNDGTGHWEAGFNKWYDAIKFTNGYGNHRPSFTIEVENLWTGVPQHPEWGGGSSHCFIITLGAILSTQNIANGKE